MGVKFVDTLGLMAWSFIHSADIQDRDGGAAVVKPILKGWPWLRHIFGGGCGVPRLPAHCYDQEIYSSNVWDPIGQMTQGRKLRRIDSPQAAQQSPKSQPIL
jgi:hypothetical protein